MSLATRFRKFARTEPVPTKPVGFFCTHEESGDMIEVTCPECAATVELETDVVAGEIISCAECAVELEVIEGDPWTLTRAPEEEEDWGE